MSINRSTTFALLASLQLACFSTTGLAQSDEKWEHTLAPLFLWGMSVDGTSVLDGMAADLDLDFEDDILENMEGVFTIHYEARKGDLVMFAEYQHVNLTPELGGAAGRAQASADIDFTQQGLPRQRPGRLPVQSLGLRVRRLSSHGLRLREQQLRVQREPARPDPRSRLLLVGATDQPGAFTHRARSSSTRLPPYPMAVTLEI